MSSESTVSARLYCVAVLGRSDQLLVWRKVCNLTPTPTAGRQSVVICDFWLRVRSESPPSLCWPLPRQKPHYPPLLSGLSLAPRAHVHWCRQAAILLFTDRYLLQRRGLPAKPSACSRVWKFYQTWAVHLNWKMAANANNMKCWPPSRSAFCVPHCKKKRSHLYCWSCQCQYVCSLWLSWKRLRNVWLGRMFLWPEWNESRFFLLCVGVRGPVGVTSEELLKSVILRLLVPPQGVHV